MSNNLTETIHYCDINRPCPVLIGKCEGPDPEKWTRLKVLSALDIDASALIEEEPQCK